MNHEDYSFEEIDRSIEALDLDSFEEGGTRHFTAEAAAADPRGVLDKVCEIYKAIRPILVALSKFPLIPKKWRKALKTFIGLMDKLCPQG